MSTLSLSLSLSLSQKLLPLLTSFCLFTSPQDKTSTHHQQPQNLTHIIISQEAFFYKASLLILKPTSFNDASTNSPSLRAFFSLYISVCLSVCLSFFLSFCVFLSLIPPRELLQACLRVMHPPRVHPSPQH